MACELCEKMGGELIWQSPKLRVVFIDDKDYPGFCRVIWSDHIKEMTDLDDSARSYFMSTVFIVERILRSILQPDKINLASLGNQTPHLHWHIIPRWETDRNFPNPIWTDPLREASLARGIASKLQELRESLVKALSHPTE